MPWWIEAIVPGTPARTWFRYEPATRVLQPWRDDAGIDPRTGERHHVLTEPDQRFELTIRRSQDRIVLAAHSRTTSECWEVVDGEAVSLRPRVDGVEYDVERDTDRWLFLSNDEATEFALSAEASPTAPALDPRLPRRVRRPAPTHRARRHPRRPVHHCLPPLRRLRSRASQE